MEFPGASNPQIQCCCFQFCCLEPALCLTHLLILKKILINQKKIKRGHGMVWDGLTQTKNKDMFCVKKQSNSRSGTFIEDMSKWWWVDNFKYRKRLSLSKCWSLDYHIPKYRIFFLFGSLRQSSFLMWWSWIILKEYSSTFSSPQQKIQYASSCKELF